MNTAFTGLAALLLSTTAIDAATVNCTISLIQTCTDSGCKSETVRQAFLFDFKDDTTVWCIFGKMESRNAPVSSASLRTFPKREDSELWN